MSARTDIADALSTIEGINCSLYYRNSTKNGDAHLRLATKTVDDTGLGFIDRWEIVIPINQNVAQTEQWIEEHAAEIIEALSPEMIITAITPREIAFESAVVNGVIIEGARPSD